MWVHTHTHVLTMGNGHLVLSQFVDGDEVGVDTHTHTHTHVITMGNGHLVLSQFVDGDEVGIDTLTHTYTQTHIHTHT